MGITQRQAAAATMIVLASVCLATVALIAFDPRYDWFFVVVALGGLCMNATLLWLHGRRWRHAPAAATVGMALLIGLTMPEPFVTDIVSIGLALSPALALLLGNRATIVAVAVLQCVLLVWRAGGRGAHVDPFFLLLYGAFVTTLVIGHQLFEGLRQRAVDEGRQARAALEEARSTAASLMQSSDEIRFQAALLQAVEHAVVATDLHGNITYFNGAAERLYGWSAREVLGADAIELLCTDLSRQVAMEMMARLRRGESWSGEFHACRRDGSDFPAVSTNSPIHDGTGALMGVVGVSRDVSDRKRAELEHEQLGRAEKLRAVGEMASGVAHDLNQSLAVVAGYSDIARAALRGADVRCAEAEEALELVARAALQGGDTISRLLRFTRKYEDARPRSVDLGELARDVVKLTAPRWRDLAQAEGRPISMKLDIEGAALRVDGHAPELVEALTNLIFNAVDALPNGGTVTLRVRREGAQVIVELSDDGVGMSPQVQRRLFEPFFTTKGERGTGLGLAMVFGIVDRHRGQIGASSELGQGTTFRLVFPAAVDAPAETVRAPHSEPARRLRVLVVDDEELIRRMVQRGIGGAHEVVTAESAEAAIRLLAERSFDVVLSDLGLGVGMNGWDLAAQVRERWPHLYFVLSTGWGTPIDPDEARAKGVDAFVPKPYRIGELLQLLADLGGANDTGQALSA